MNFVLDIYVMDMVHEIKMNFLDDLDRPPLEKGQSCLLNLIRMLLMISPS